MPVHAAASSDGISLGNMHDIIHQRLIENRRGDTSAQPGIIRGPGGVPNAHQS